MDEILYNSLYNYFHALQLKGYMPYKAMMKLLVLGFYRDFVFSDYRGIITRDDYLLIERALDCLYGTTCLIPYPDYLKMGNLNLGSISELASRVKTLEETNVLKVINDLDSAEGTLESDVLVLAEE
jgi:hypothetical protein